MMVLMTSIAGESRITETIFENRFQHVTALQAMGASLAWAFADTGVAARARQRMA